MQVNGGDIVEYRVTVKNTGTMTLSNVVIQDEIPSYEGSLGNLTLVADSLSGDVTIKNGIITWNLGTLQPSQSQSVTFRVNVPTTAGQTLQANTAYVSYGEDPNNPDETIPSNTVAIEENPASSQIGLLKEQRKIVNGIPSAWNTQDRNNPMIVNGGDVVEYRLISTVIGSTPLNNVTIRDTIPDFEGAAGDLVLVTGSLGPNATVVGKTITWNLETMQPSQSQSVTFQVQVPTTAGQTLWANIGTVSHGNDPNNPTGQVSSNEVDIREPVGSNTLTPTPPNGTTNITNNSPRNNPSSNKTSETTNKTPAYHNGSKALTSTETNVRFGP